MLMIEWKDNYVENKKDIPLSSREGVLKIEDVWYTSNEQNCANEFQNMRHRVY